MELPSGRFVLRLHPVVHQQLKLQAEARGISLNEWVTRIIGRPDRRFSSEHQSVLLPIQSVFGNQLEGAILFGSVVRNEQRENSDIDLLIVLKKEVLIDRSLYRCWDESVAPHIGSKYTPQFSHLPDPAAASSLWLEISLEGEILQDIHGHLDQTLRKIRIEISENHYRRKMSHGHPYWIRNKSEDSNAK